MCYESVHFFEYNTVRVVVDDAVEVVVAHLSLLLDVVILDHVGELIGQVIVRYH